MKKRNLILTVISFIYIYAIFPQTMNQKQTYRFNGESLALENYRKAIYDTLLATDNCICDVNNDGEINCQDWALTFYSIWNSTYYLSDTVALVRNINQSSGMNHLFIAVRYASCGAQWEYIEPQAFKNGICNRSYFMMDYWGRKYNPIFNEINTNLFYKQYFLNKR